MIHNVNIKYTTSEKELLKIEQGDWVDLRCWNVNLIKFEDIIKYDATDTKPYLKREQVIEPLKWQKGIFDGEDVDFIPYTKGDFLSIDLGIAMELPSDYEAYVVPRGSSFKHYGTIQTNHIGIIDNSYKGDNDIWFLPLLAMRDGFIMKGERVCQFRIQKRMEPIAFNKVLKLDNSNRSGHGSTGTM